MASTIQRIETSPLDPQSAEQSLLSAIAQGDRGTALRLALELTEQCPQRGLPWKLAGALLWAEGRSREALQAMETSVRILATDAEAHCNLGLTLAKLDRFAEAERALQKALDIDSSFATAHYRLGMTYALQGRLHEAQASLQRGIALRADYAAGDDAQNHSNLLFLKSHDPGIDAQTLLLEHRRFGEFLEQPLRSAWRAHENDRDPERCIKVGMVSGDLYDHSVGNFLECSIEGLNGRDGIELHAYSIDGRHDAVSSRLQKHFSTWTLVESLDPDELAMQIRADRIDVLIDLAGHTGPNRLPTFARRPAPIQASWLGYPGTTGLASMDYYFADEHWLPPGQFDALFTEKLVYLPERWSFRPHAHAPAVASAPSLTSGQLTFGSFHGLAKLNSATLELWCKLLSSLPGSRMLLAGIPLDGREYDLVRQFTERGIDRTRLMLERRCAMRDYLSLHERVDIALDTLPYTGATTTLHSLSMGVPTLTIAGSTSQGRAGAGILAHLQLDEFIAADADDFIAKARHWALRVGQLAQLRRQLRPRLLQTPGAQPTLIAAHLALALRHMWQRWCGELQPETFATHAGTAPRPNNGSDIDTACARAMALQLSGRCDQARLAYAQILEKSPDHPAVNYGFGMLQVQLQRPTDGLPFLKKALQSALETPDYWLGYLEALLLAGRHNAARNILQLGRQHGLAGASVEEFARRLEAALAQRSTATHYRVPSGPPASPEYSGPDALEEESRLLAMLATPDREAILKRARSLTLRHPQRGLGWKILGAFLPTSSGYAEAIAVLRKAVELLPKDAEAHTNLGVTLARDRQFAAAEAHLQKAMTLDPQLAAAHYRLGMTYELQGRYAEAETSLRLGRSLDARSDHVAGDNELSASHLLFLMSHNPEIDAQQLFVEHRRYGELVERPLRGSWPQHQNDRTPNRRLRIGFVSGDLHEHSVGQFLEPVAEILGHDANLELHAFRANPVEDGLSRRLQGHFKSWESVAEFSDAQLAARITDQRIDILVDLSGHTGFNRLPVFARKPAPVQVSWLGYPGTTGLEAVDYYLADASWLPQPEFAALFSEKLVYLPDRWAFRPHANAPEVGPLPALVTGELTFGSFHRLGKINPATVFAWSRVLLCLPKSTLLIVGIPVDGQEQRLLAQFAAHGIAADRLRVHGRSTMDVYLAFHNLVDLALDTVPYAGATTTMHSLSMGVPTLTIGGNSSQARAGAGILCNAGLHRFIACDVGAMVTQAQHWARHLSELADIRMGLRSRLAARPSGKPDVIAACLSHALRHMWRRWCAGLPSESFSQLLPDAPTQQ